VVTRSAVVKYEDAMGSIRSAYLLLAAVIVLWGANWPLMKIGVQTMTPLWFATSRALIGSACLFAWLVATRRLAWPAKRDLPLLFSIAILQIAAGLALIHWGLRFVEAGRSAILAYTFPLWVAPLAAVVLKERLGRSKLLGLALGMAGILLLFHPEDLDPSRENALLGHGLLLFSAMLWAVAVVHIRGHRWAGRPADLMPWQLLLGGFLLAIMAAATDGFPPIDWTPSFAAVLAYNGVVASAFCFWAYTTVARRLPAMSTALGSLGVPVVGVIASALVLRDMPGLATLGGLALISGGVALVSLADLRGR
jgi:drug/metabolite transporter (DMT)-like permease